MKIIIIALFTSTMLNLCYAHSAVPENGLSISTSSKSNSNITEHEFDQIILELEELYLDEEITFLKDWEDDTVNAYAQVYDSKRYISVLGGFARYPVMTKDAFALVLCHEIGHHIAGAPRMTASWASAEGQSDYFASSKCMKRYLQNKDNATFVDSLNLEDRRIATEKCSAVYGGNDISLCIRNIVAGRDLAVVFGNLEQYLTLMPAISTPTAFKVAKTNKDKYPSSQCRLDTFVSGALCINDIEASAHHNNPFTSYCKNNAGARPRCWFSPSDYGHKY